MVGVIVLTRTIRTPSETFLYWFCTLILLSYSTMIMSYSLCFWILHVGGNFSIMQGTWNTSVNFLGTKSRRILLGKILVFQKKNGLHRVGFSLQQSCTHFAGALVKTKDWQDMLNDSWFTLLNAWGRLFSRKFLHSYKVFLLIYWFWLIYWVKYNEIFIVALHQAPKLVISHSQSFGHEL